MITLEARYGRIVSQKDATIIVRLNCLAVEDGNVTLLEHCDFKMVPTDNLATVLSEAEARLATMGYSSLPAQVSDGLETLSTIEHTAQVIQEYRDGPSPSAHEGIKKECCFSQVDILPDGQIAVRLRKCLVVNGEIKGEPGYHRFVIVPGENHASRIGGIVEHLDQMGCGPILADDIARITRICEGFHTATVIEAYIAAVAARDS